MKFSSKDFRVREGDEVDLRKWPTTVEPVYESKEHYHKLLGEHVAQLSSLQQLLYASNRYAVLLIFQAMDAAGKDGAIKHVMSGVNPQGCQVYSFKHPSPAELQHDFLWRTTRDLPERGRIGIFNRSYYEEVLIARVHPEILRSEGLPDLPHDDEAVWHDRYRSIVNLERHLHSNGTRIVKFYLHLSKEEQRKRFLQRIDEPEKNWKFSLADVEERKFWKQYMKAYEECLSATSIRDAPWYVVPADDKENARLIVSRIVLDTLEGLEMTYPKTSAERRQELQSIRSGSRSEILNARREKVVTKEGTMYTHILIPTDGSELAGKAVQDGIALAKRIGAKATALTVLPPFHVLTTDTQMLEDTPAQYKVRMQAHAEKTLAPSPRQRKQQASPARWFMSSMSIPIRRSSIPRSRKAVTLSSWHRTAATASPRSPRQRDGQGAHAFQDPGIGPSLSRAISATCVPAMPPITRVQCGLADRSVHRWLAQGPPR